MEENYNAADENEVKAQEKKNENARKQELEDLRDILRTHQGVRFLRKLVSDGHVFHSSMTGNSQTFFNEGWRAFALKIIGDVMEASPNKLIEILIEKKDEGKK
jgi:hypothetical protein